MANVTKLIIVNTCVQRLCSFIYYWQNMLLCSLQILLHLQFLFDYSSHLFSWCPNNILLYNKLCLMILWYWCKTNRLPDISPGKIGLFWISRQLQFRVCDHNKPRGSPHMAREGDPLYRGGKEVGSAIVDTPRLSLARKEEESFFFLWVSAIITGHESTPSGLLALTVWVP